MDHCVGAKNGMVAAKWNAGKVVVNLSSVLPENGQDVLQFTFEVVNRHWDYGDAGDLGAQYSLASLKIPSQTALSGPAFSNNALGSSAWHTESGLTTLFAEDRANVYMQQAAAITAGNYPARYSSTNHNFQTAEATGDRWATVQPKDGKPLYVKRPTFSFTEIRQSSPFPCDSNNVITVSLRSSVALITGYCPYNITISGLRNFVNRRCTASTTRLEVGKGRRKVRPLSHKVKSSDC
jgi:hypothetical protein